MREFVDALRHAEETGPKGGIYIQNESRFLPSVVVGSCECHV